MKLAIVLWATSPDSPHLCATPFYHAATAAAMEAEVVVYFTSRSVLLLEDGVPQNLYAAAGAAEPVYHFMRNAAELGVEFHACGEALAAHGVDRSHLIPEFSGIAGAAWLMERVFSADWKVMTY